MSSIRERHKSGAEIDILMEEITPFVRALAMFRRSKKIEGEIAFHNLDRWWLTAFTEKEAEYIERKFKPMGAAPDYSLIRGKILSSSQSPAGFLTGLSSWFRGSKDRSIQIKILLEAENHAESVLDRHFVYSCLIEYHHYGVRSHSNNKTETVRYCDLQIAIASKASKEFKREFRKSPLPRHIGFGTLAIIQEKDGDFAGAMDVCRQARKAAWAGDWDKRINRCRGKAEKQKSLQRPLEKPKQYSLSLPNLPSRLCGRCGSERTPGARFCGSCGIALD